GARNRGVRPNRAVTGSRNVVRTLLQQLDASGYTVIKKNLAGTKELGRIVTPAGQSLLDQVSKEIRPSAEEAAPGLGKY
ncbi:MAG TPA: 40S ribosomal protein S19, partial [Candidatus Thalassarchaeaceae archaeon]